MNDTRIAWYCDLFLCLSLSLFASRPLKAAIRLNSKTVMAGATAFDGKVGIRSTRAYGGLRGHDCAVDPASSTAADTAQATLEAGFTTVQSAGAAVDELTYSRGTTPCSEKPQEVW
jgi:hypothetical protein